MARRAGGTRQPQTSLGKGLQQGGCGREAADLKALTTALAATA